MKKNTEHLHNFAVKRSCESSNLILVFVVLFVFCCFATFFPSSTALCLVFIRLETQAARKKSFGCRKMKDRSKVAGLLCVFLGGINFEAKKRHSSAQHLSRVPLLNAYHRCQMAREVLTTPNGSN